MKLLLVIPALLSLTFAPAAAAPQPPKAQVMFVGVAHLVSHRDVHNSVFTDSPLSPKRQAQIADVVAHLARFHPTKVLVEAQMDDPKTEREYAAYLAHRFTLGANEVYQFGFRLAAASGNTAIYPVDTFGPSLIDESTARGKTIYAYLEKHFTDIHDARFDEYVARENQIERAGSYLDLLRFLNTDAAILANASSYSVLDGMGRNANQAGAAYVAQWYSRNCYIFANIAEVVKPGDRVVILMGQGHEYLQREFIRLDPDFVDIDPLTYLR